MSMSGMEPRRCFEVKRSNNKPYLSGSIVTNCNRYATTEPDTEPLPGPIIMFSSRAYLYISHMISMYDVKPNSSRVSSS